jgi:hypothetical protein
MRKSGLVGRMTVINADNTIVKAIHLLMVLMVIFLLSYDKSQEFFESYYPEMHTFT